MIAACMERGIDVDFKKTSRYDLLELWRASLKDGYREYSKYLDTLSNTVATDDCTTICRDAED